MRKCDRKGCDKEGAWYPELILWLPLPYQGRPARLRVNLAVCDACKPTITVEDIVTDESWTQIVELFQKVKRDAPARERTKLAFMSALSIEAETMQDLFQKSTNKP